MADAPTVSVLMGVYNEEDYLSDAIESVIDQTFEDFEFLIVDDDSDDSSPEIVRSYDDSRITLIENEVNRGLTKSLNRALDRASGTYVARQDADDISAPERFEKQVGFLEAHDEVALVGTGAQLIDDEGNALDTRIGYCNPTYSDLLEKNHIIHGSILARRRVFEKLDGYDEFYQYSQDYNLWLQLAKTHRIANLPEPLYKLRVHDESVYFSRKDESALYSKFAHDLARGTVGPDTEADLRQNGILQYWDHLSNEERAAVHRELAIRYLRYGHCEPALEECYKAKSAAGLDLTLAGLLTLAYIGEPAISLTRWGFRRYLNLKARVHNRFFCPYDICG